MYVHTSREECLGANAAKSASHCSDERPRFGFAGRTPALNGECSEINRGLACVITSTRTGDCDHWKRWVLAWYTEEDATGDERCEQCVVAQELADALFHIGEVVLSQRSLLY